MTHLADLVAAELAKPVDPRVEAFARDIAGTFGEAARAVLFYGSCLRSSELDGLMLDFYVIVSGYRDAYDRRWMAAANRLIPPNVFPAQHEGLQAKYAVLSEDDFARLASSRTRNVSVWARFAQPSRLVWAKDEAARGRAIAAVCGAAPALLSSALPLAPESVDPLDLWRFAFGQTYRAELRAERPGRSLSVVDADPERYRAFTDPALAAIDHDALQTAGAARWRWRRRRFEGKALTLLRLAKASATYAGGVDYLAWKINRHAGTDITVRPWQRRWPLIGALTLLPRLIFRGAVR
ncbi:MAG: hypothetical protein HKN78_09995 [Sphingomonadaceae bacterium]|nr:hypothetical protein [Sphingomonadaceae bacterium]